MRRSAFTLLELLLTVGIIGTLASIVLAAVNPAAQFSAAHDAERRIMRREIQNAVENYLIAKGSSPGSQPITGTPMPICRPPTTDPACVNIDVLVSEGYITAIPVDIAEANIKVTGYSIAIQNSRPVVASTYLGAGSSMSSSIASASSSSACASLQIGTLDEPIFGFDSGGNTAYANATDAFTVAATPLSMTLDGEDRLFFTGHLNVSIIVNSAGALVSGTAGNDFSVTGDVDANGDWEMSGPQDYYSSNGPLLTGEVTYFHATDSGGSSDSYSLRFRVTGGQMQNFFAGKDIGMALNSLNSNFTGNFNVNFGGGAIGSFGAVDDC